MAAPPLGFQIINEPSLGHFAIVLTAAWKCQPIKLRGSSPSPVNRPVLPPLPGIVPSEDKGKEKEKEKEDAQWNESLMRESFHARIAPLLSTELPHVPLISTTNPAALSYSSPECLAFLIKSCMVLEDGYVLHIHHLNEEITNRFVEECCFIAHFATQA